MIDNLLKEIRAGTTLRRTGQNSVHRRSRRRRTSQLKKDDLERLNQIVEKATANPRKSLSPVAGYESQFKFPVVDEENENESEVNKTNGVEIPNGSAKVSNGVTKEIPADEGQGITSNTGKTVSNTDTIVNGHNGETGVASLPNGKNTTVLEPEAKIDEQSKDLSVTHPQGLTSPAVGDTATKFQSLPVSPAKDQHPEEEGIPILEADTRGLHGDTKSQEKEGTGSLEKRGARSLEENGTESKGKQGPGTVELKGAKSLEDKGTESKEKEFKGTGTVEKRGERSLEERGTESREKKGTGTVEKRGARSLEEKGAQLKEKEGTGTVEKKGARLLTIKGKKSKEKGGTGSLEKKGTRSMKKKGSKEKEGTGTGEKEGRESRAKREVEKEETVSAEKDGSRTSSEASLTLMVS